MNAFIERERESESETTFFSSSSERALFLDQSLLLSFREFRAETHQWIYPDTVWARFIYPPIKISLSLFFLFLLTHFISFSLSFIKNNNKTTTDRSKRE
jgi:hypothetical protein